MPPRGVTKGSKRERQYEHIKRERARERCRGGARRRRSPRERSTSSEPAPARRAPARRPRRTTSHPAGAAGCDPAVADRAVARADRAAARATSSTRRPAGSASSNARRCARRSSSGRSMRGAADRTDRRTSMLRERDGTPGAAARSRAGRMRSPPAASCARCPPCVPHAEVGWGGHVDDGRAGGSPRRGVIPMSRARRPGPRKRVTLRLVPLQSLPRTASSAARSATAPRPRCPPTSTPSRRRSPISIELNLTDVDP